MKKQGANATIEDTYRANPAIIPENLPFFIDFFVFDTVMVDTDGHLDEICSPLRHASRLVCQGISMKDCLKGEELL